MLELLVGFLVGAVGIGGLVFTYYSNREDLTQYHIIHEAINEAVNKKDRYVTMYFSEQGIQASVYPLVDMEEEQK